jgi:hypothetical protein
VVKEITTPKKRPQFNPHAFLSTIGKGRDMVSFPKEGKNMTRFESSYKPPMFMALLFVALVTGGGIGRVFATVAPGVTVAPGTLVAAATEPTVVSSSPSNNATNVPTSINVSDNVVTGTAVTATFSQPMDPETVNSFSAGNSLTFTVTEANGNDFGFRLGL